MLILHLASVVIREFNIVGIPIFKSKTYAPLVIDGNGILPFPFPFQFMKSIARGHLQILQPSRVIDIFQPPYCPPTIIWWKSFRFPCLVQFQCVPVGKSLDHRLIVICHVTRVNGGVNSPPNAQAKLRGHTPSRRAAVRFKRLLGADNFIKAFYYLLYLFNAYQSKFFPDTLN